MIARCLPHRSTASPPARRHRPPRLICLPAFAAALAAAAPAAGTVLTPRQLKDLSVEQLLEQEVISVSRRPEALADAASNVFYLTGDASRRTGAANLPELLRSAPNLFVAQSSSHHWGVTARGFLRTNAHSSKLLVLIDGRSVYSPLFSNVFWDATETFLPDLAAVEVLSGPNGANWGSNAVNGIINIRSKTAHETVGSLLQVSAGPELVQVEARRGVRFGQSGAMRFYVSRTQREASLSARGAEDGKDDWHALLAGFRADWGTPEKGTFTLQGEGLRGSYDNFPLDRFRVENAHAILTWRRQRSAAEELWARLYYTHDRRDLSMLLMQTTQTADFEFQHRRELADGQQLMWGGNFRRIRDLAEDTVGFAILPEKVWYNLTSGFIQHEVPVRERFRLTTGIRAEHTGLTNEWEFLPTVRLAWRGDRRTAWVSAARAARTPSRVDRGLHIPKEPPFTTAGGPDFTAEMLTAFEFGWRAQPRAGLSYSAALFLHDYDNLRSVDPDVPINVENDVEGRSYGIELFMDYQINPRWRFRLGGFWMEQETWIEPGGSDAERARGESSVPDYRVLLSSTVQLTPSTEVWLGLRNVGEVPADAGGGGTVPAHTELDARWGWRVRPNLEISLVGRNLLNESHPEIGGATARREIKRSVYARARWEF